MSLDDFAVQYLPELRLPQHPEFLSDETIFDRERLPTSAVVPVLGALYDAVPRKLDAQGNATTTPPAH